MSTSVTTQPFRVAILSDLHAFDKLLDDKEIEPSHLCTLATEDSPGHPIRTLMETIDAENLKVDLILCPGDLGDKARNAGIGYSWTAIQKLKAKLNASLVAATVGNHDIDSRHKSNDHDPIGYLQSLTPAFPLPTDNLNDKFWARTFAIVEEPQFRLVVLNSSAFHGYSDSEQKHGRISDRTLTSLESALRNSADKPLNILLCHHHPHKHCELKLGEYDEMLGGQQLIDLLGSNQLGQWIIIHGHKHHPKLCYAAGTSGSPIVFSAGSLCAKLYADLATAARNQFYLLEFPLSKYNDLGLVGTFTAWDWSAGIGWQPARPGSGLPGRGGFGFRGNVFEMASKINAVTPPTGGIDWIQILKLFPEAEYLLPKDLDRLIKVIEQRHSIRTHFDSVGYPQQIGR